VICKACVLFVLLTVSGTSVGTPDQDQVVAVTVEPKEAYIENRGSERRVNFDLLLHNSGTQPLRINKIEVSVYDADGALAFRRYIVAKSRRFQLSFAARSVSTFFALIWGASFLRHG